MEKDNLRGEAMPEQPDQTPQSKEQRSPFYSAMIPVQAVQSDDATVVIMEVPWGQHVTASSKREPGDQRNYARGYRLALARAMVKLGREIERAERKQIKAEIEEAESAVRLAAEIHVAKMVERERTRPEREARAARARAEALKGRRKRV